MVDPRMAAGAMYLCFWAGGAVGEDGGGSGGGGEGEGDEGCRGGWKALVWRCWLGEGLGLR